jgi:hypothetical protein
VPATSARASAPHSTSGSARELRRLIVQLEHSGMAAHRPEVAALLARSRALLHERRPWPVRALERCVGGLLRRMAAVTEAWRWGTYHLAWGWDWFAEAFSTAAMDRLEARITAREVMGGWRAHRRTLPAAPGLTEVAAFLAETYGAQAATAFNAAAAELAEALPWTLRGGPARNAMSGRLAALRWSALIRCFEGLARSGALWPSPEPVIPAALTPAAPDDAANRAERVADLQDQIRRKRQDITAAFAWKLKTEAESDQRDGYVAQLRAEIAALEQELARPARG